MKTRIKILVMGFFFALFCFGTFTAFADDPNPPIVPGEHGVSGDVPVGAPIDNGIIFLLVAGTAYAIYRLYEVKKKASKEIIN